MTNEEIFAKTTINSWKLAVGRLDHMFSSLSDEELQAEVAPGRSRVLYLLGHLTAVHDRMLPLLGFGERLHPELDEAFISKPDGEPADRASAGDLRRGGGGGNKGVLGALVPPP